MTSIRKIQVMAISAIAGGILVCGSAASAAATSIPINDYDFSTPALASSGYQATGNPPGIEGWVAQGGALSNGGVENETGTGKFTSTTLSNWPVSDTQALFVGNTFPAGTVGDYAYYDVTTNSPGAPTWQPNTTYKLTVDFGEPLASTGLNTPGSMALGTFTDYGSPTATTAFAYNDNLTATPGDMQQYSITASTGATVPSGDMIIFLANADPNDEAQNSSYAYTQAFYTDVQLTASPAPAPATGCLLLVGAGLLLVVSRRRRTTPSVDA